MAISDQLVAIGAEHNRMIDGAPAARFLQRVKQLIERPFALALLD